MELGSRKKTKRNKIIRSKSFETQEMRDRSEGSRRVEKLSNLMDGNNRRCFPDGTDAMA